MINNIFSDNTLILLYAKMLDFSCKKCNNITEQPNATISAWWIIPMCLDVWTGERVDHPASAGHWKDITNERVQYHQHHYHSYHHMHDFCSCCSKMAFQSFPKSVECICSSSQSWSEVKQWFKSGGSPLSAHLPMVSSITTKKNIFWNHDKYVLQFG